MNIVYDKASWKVDDIFNTLVLLQNGKNEKIQYSAEFKKRYKEINDSILYLKKYIDETNFALRFINEVHNGISFNLDMDELNKISKFEIPRTIRDYIKFYRYIDIDLMRKGLLYKLYINHNNLHNTDYNSIQNDIIELLNSSKLLFDFISKLRFDDDIKWQLMNFFNDPKLYYYEYSKIIEKFMPHYEIEIGKYEYKINVTNAKVKEIVDKNGIESFINKISALKDINIDGIQEVHFQYTIINATEMDAKRVDDVLYITIGIEIEERERNKKIINENLDILNVITDINKFSILQTLSINDLTKIDICATNSLSESAFTKYMDELINYGLVYTKEVNDNIYYSMNREHLGEPISYISTILGI